MPVWVLRGGDENRWVDPFVDGGVAAVAFDELDDGRQLERRHAVRRLEEGGRFADPADAFNRFHQFASVFALGDPVLLPDPARKDVVVGLVDGPYEFDDSHRFRHRRAVRWVGRHGRDEMPAAWATTIAKQRPVLQRYDAEALDRHVAAVIAGEVGRPARERGRAASSRSSSGSRSSGASRLPGASRAPAKPKAPPRLLRTCPGCGFNLNVVLFDGEDLCRDCR